MKHYTLVALLALLTSCQSVEQRERAFTAQCKQEPGCKKQGLCAGSCSPGPCRCVATTETDCNGSENCVALGECTLLDAKCVVATTPDCQKAPACKATGACSFVDGKCVVARDEDCKLSDLCRTQQRCRAQAGTCVDRGYNQALRKPELTNEEAPERFKVLFNTNRGNFTVEVTKAWAPHGVTRLYNLLRIGYYQNSAVLHPPGDLLEFGIHSNPDVTATWQRSPIQDDPPAQPNDRGYVSFAASGPNSRYAPLVIHLRDHRSLKAAGIAPVGRVVDGMNVVEMLSRAQGNAPDVATATAKGSVYLKDFPDLDYVTIATIQ